MKKALLNCILFTILPFLVSCNNNQKYCDYPLDCFGYPYNFPKNINIKNNDYRLLGDYATSNNFINDKLVGFLIRLDDVESFKNEHPQIEYYAFDNLFYSFGKNSRVPLYSVVGDNELNYLSTPSYIVFSKV